MSRVKRARLDIASPRWLDLEAGIWESVFTRLRDDDLRSARQVCSDFLTVASRTIRQLVVGSVYEGNSLVAASPEAILEQIVSLPGRMTGLRTVHMAHSLEHLPGVAVRLASLTSFTQLFVSGEDQPFTLGIVQPMLSLSNLRTLTLESCNFSDAAALQCMGDLRGLKKLVITKCHPYHRSLLQAIAQLKGLTSLELTKPFCFTDEGYSALASLSNLQDLHIGWTWRLGSGPETLAFLTGLQSLRRLALTKCFVSDAGLQWVGELRNLEQLQIRSCHNVTGIAFQGLAGLTNLVELDLEGSHMITDEGVRCIASISTLQALNLGSSKATAGVFEALQDMPNLRHLMVPDTLYTRPPASVREKLLPRLETYGSMRCWRGRPPGGIEEQLHGLLKTDAAMMSRPIVTTRILEWFQRG